jgi:MFS transporter, DHA1 family, multidrug resistance protein
MTMRKMQVTYIVCSMALSLSYASSAYTASTQHLITYFNVSEEVIILGVAIYVIGFAVGPLLFGPAAQVFGHRAVYISTFIAFTGFSFGVSEAKNIATILFCRFFAAMFGSSAFSNAPATIGDIVLPKNAYRYLLNYGIAVFAGPVLGPLIGAFIDHRAGWRWNLRVQALFIALNTIVCILCLPETNHLVLQARANEAQATKMSKTARIKKVLQAYKVYLSQPFIVLFTEPVVLLVALYLGILYAILYLSFLVVPLVFVEVRHFTAEQNGLVFISMLIGFSLSAIMMLYCQERYATAAFAKLEPGQKPPPELRLRQTIWSSALAPIGLFIFAWTAPFTKVHWIVPCIGLAIAFFGIFSVFSSFVPYLVEYGGVRAPIVMAGQTALRCTLGAAFPLFGRQMFSKLTIQGGSSLLAGLALIMTPLAACFYVYGERLRSLNRKV